MMRITLMRKVVKHHDRIGGRFFSRQTSNDEWEVKLENNLSSLQVDCQKFQPRTICEIQIRKIVLSEYIMKTGQNLTTFVLLRRPISFFATERNWLKEARVISI